VLRTIHSTVGIAFLQAVLPTVHGAVMVTVGDATGIAATLERAAKCIRVILVEAVLSTMNDVWDVFHTLLF
jgi:cysteine synthase